MSGYRWRGGDTTTLLGVQSSRVTISITVFSTYPKARARNHKQRQHWQKQRFIVDIVFRRTAEVLQLFGVSERKCSTIKTGRCSVTKVVTVEKLLDCYS